MAAWMRRVTTTTRFVNSLAPHSGERLRERGSFSPFVVVPKSGLAAVADRRHRRFAGVLRCHSDSSFQRGVSWWATDR
jgi:hypothetical protein